MIILLITETGSNDSETGESDDEFENGNERACSCVIM